MSELRSGYTTGACAAAAACAATQALLSQRRIIEVSISFPGGDVHNFPVHSCNWIGTEASTSIIKDAGDDPDVTNGAEIFARVEKLAADEQTEPVTIHGGKGVGRVTKPGLSCPVDGPAINPVPLQMIREAVAGPLEKWGGTDTRLKITISVQDGEELAKKTLNKRLGIIGGLSILGTTGIVRPISAHAWTETIEASMRVARAAGLDEVILSTGRTSEAAVEKLLNLPEEAGVMMGDYLDYALKAARKHGFQRVHLACMWAKMLKCALGIAQTHVRHGALEMEQAAALLEELGLEAQRAAEMAGANTAREIYQRLVADGEQELIHKVCVRARQQAEKRCELEVRVYLVTSEQGIVVREPSIETEKNEAEKNIRQSHLVQVYGISGEDLPQDHLEAIRKCHAVVVSRRHSRLLADVNIEQIQIAPVQEMLKRVASALQLGDVAILASGDPLFFGIGRTLLDRFGMDRVTIIPALSALQLACARFKIPWDDLNTLSLHGRDPDGIMGRILSSITKNRIMLFTDQRNSPDQIAGNLLALLKEYRDTERISRIRVRVAENLGLADERLWSGTLSETAQAQFSPLNMMLLEEVGASPASSFPLGLREKEISHVRGLITKDEVRAVVLHCLRLPRAGVFWDVGGGSGSISVEAARLCPGLQIYSIEQKKEGQEQIRANIVRYNLYNIHLICGQAPEILANLPDPDRVFIGGNSGLLSEIIHHCADLLPAGGRIVASAVLQQVSGAKRRLRTAEQAPRLMAKNGLAVDLRTIAVTRAKYPETEGKQSQIRLNPITIISGKK